ncbi:MAG TPA: ATP-binding protein [Jatrophihabitantaceae bacterium]|jgi:anti-sigma regulatory factor (Ser/Thr protein kinase)|nr:ATP-binding protein [Jatrophihabitantaceae bacterium]
MQTAVEGGPDQRVSRIYPGDITAPARARHFCAEHLSQVLGSSTAAQDMIADLVLVTSELVTNAFNAGSHEICVDLCRHGDRIQLAVHDHSTQLPAIREAAAHEDRGRGLAIVASIAGGWQVEQTHDGKVVWLDFELSEEFRSAAPS